MEKKRDGEPGGKEKGAAAEKAGESVVGGGEVVKEEVMDKGAVAEDLEGLPEAEARREEPYHLAVPLLLLNPHLSIETLTLTLIRVPYSLE